MAPFAGSCLMLPQGRCSWLFFFFFFPYAGLLFIVQVPSPPRESYPSRSLPRHIPSAQYPPSRPKQDNSSLQ